MASSTATREADRLPAAAAPALHAAAREIDTADVWMDAHGHELDCGEQDAAGERISALAQNLADDLIAEADLIRHETDGGTLPAGALTVADALIACAIDLTDRRVG